MNDEENIEDKAKLYGVPIIGNTPHWQKRPEKDPNPVTAICGNCGLTIRRIMNYSCPYDKCPILLKGHYDFA